MQGENVMRKILFALSGVAVALATTPTAAQVTGEVCTKYKNGACVSTHKVRGSPYQVGYVFGPTYSYTALSDLPQPVVVQNHLSPDSRYVYSNGYLYVVDPSSYAVTQVITVPH
jgi:hypothetical protein